MPSPINELTWEDPSIQQPPDIDIDLKPHQLTAVYKCLQIEQNPIVISDTVVVKTRIGIIGDSCGSGKSFCVMALLVDTLEREDDIIYQSYCRNRFTVELLNLKTQVRTKLLLIPHSLLSQWTGYLKHIKNKRYAIIGRASALRDVVSKGIASFDFLMVTDTFYRGLLDQVTIESLKFDRLIIDEADQIRITPCQMEIDASFYWFVSACPNNFLYPTGLRVVEYGANSATKQITGIKHTGFIRNMFFDISHTSMLHSVIVKNADAFVQASFKLMDVVHRTIRCRSSQAINVLYGLVNKNIMNCLNADDMEAAMGFISSSRKGNETNVIGMLMDKYERQLSNIRLELDFNSLVHHESDEAKERAAERIEKDMEKIRNDIENVKRRLLDTQTCCICYDDIDKKTIAPCCSNAFCFKCINTWMSTNQTCPLCKHTITSDSIYVVHEDNTSFQSNSEILDKYQNLETLLKSFSADRRVLIFSEYDTSLDKIKFILGSCDMAFSSFKGHSASIAKTIDRYSKGIIKAILANTNEFGYGMNLEMTTDIILFHRFSDDVTKQAIGRAQRSGRTTQLNVWKLFHDNEM